MDGSAHTRRTADGAVACGHAPPARPRQRRRHGRHGALRRARAAAAALRRGVRSLQVRAGLLVAAYGTACSRARCRRASRPLASGRGGPFSSGSRSSRWRASASASPTSAATLGLARLAQGLGSALSWAGGLAWLVGGTPRERRGEMLGTALGAAIFGALLGPMLGAFADLTGPELPSAGSRRLRASRSLAAALRRPPPPETADVRRGSPRRPERRLHRRPVPDQPPGPPLRDPRRARPAPAGRRWAGARSRSARCSSAPPRSKRCWRRFLGRFTDRRGRLLPVRVALVSLGGRLARRSPGPERPPCSSRSCSSLPLAYGAFYAPSMSLISDGAERAGLAQGLAFGLMNAWWATGNAVGPALGGLLAELAGDALPFMLAAALCVATFLAVRPRARYAPGVGDELQQAAVRIPEVDARAVASRTQPLHGPFLDRDVVPPEVCDRLVDRPGPDEAEIAVAGPNAVARDRVGSGPARAHSAAARRRRSRSARRRGRPGLRRTRPGRTRSTAPSPRRRSPRGRDESPRGYSAD